MNRLVRLPALGGLLFCLCSGGALATTVNGTVRGADGTRPAAARVVVEAPEWARPLRVREVAADARFALDFRRDGMTLLRFRAAGHRDLVVPIPPGVGDLTLEVVLGPEPWPEPSGNVSIVSARNGFHAYGGQLMEPQPDGSFSATIVDAPQGPFAYSVVEEGTRRQLSGTQADDWDVDAHGRARAVVRREDGTFVVRFDPRLLPAAGGEPCLRVVEGPPAIERFASLYAEMRQERLRVSAAIDALEGSEEELPRLVAELEREADRKAGTVAAERDPDVRAFAAVTALAAREHLPPAKALARLGIDGVGPGHPYWGLFPHVLLGLPARAGAPLAEIRRFLQRAADESPDRRVRAEALLSLLRLARDGDPDLYDRARSALLRGLPESQEAEQVRELWPERLAIRRGDRFPRASIPALEEGRPPIDVASFRGRWVLLDFWAVWCGPCLQEIPSLARLSERFRDRLTIVSVSLDLKRDVVEGFREGQKNMPWKHGFLEKGFEHPLARRFAILGLPSYVLIGPDGTVRATTIELRNGGLEGNVSRFLGPRPRGKKTPSKGAATRSPSRR